MQLKSAPERIAGLEIQVNRLISDAISEKGTRSRMNEHFDKRLTGVEKQLWKIAGGLAVLQVILGITLVVVEIFKK